MTHRAQQIVDAVVTTLTTALAGTAAVYVGRRHTLSEAEQELAAVIVDYGADEPLGEFGATNVAFLDSLLEVNARIAVKTTDEKDALEQLLARRRDIHVALMADRSIGLAFVLDTRPAGAAAPDLDVASDATIGTLVTRWLVHYRTSLNDPA